MPEKMLVTREIPEAGLRLLEDFDVVVLSESPPEREELLEAVSGAAGILPTLTEKIDAELMDAAGDGLKVVANMAVGYDNVELEAAGERGIIVTNTPEVLNETTADTAFMLMLAAARRLGEAERLLRSGGWRRSSPRYRSTASRRGRGPTSGSRSSTPSPAGRTARGRCWHGTTPRCATA